MKKTGQTAEVHIPLPIDRVNIHDPFWDHWITMNRDVTLRYQYEQLEASGRIANFFKIFRKENRAFPGHDFQ